MQPPFTNVTPGPLHCIRHRGMLLGVILFIGLIGSPAVVYAEKVVSIGILSDGPMPEFDRLESLFTEEIKSLTEGEFDIRFNPDKRFDGGWSLDDIDAALVRLQNDSEVDMVLALGFVSSLVASRSKSLRKPTFAPMVLDANLLDLPREGDTSGERYLNYLTEEILFAEDIGTFREIVNFETLGVIVDQAIFESVPDLAARGGDWAQSLGVALVYIPVADPKTDIVGEIPSEVEAVIVTALPRLNVNQRRQLIENLNNAKLPSYSVIGTTPVRQGMLAATAPDSDWLRLARKNALNIQSVLLGENAGDQQVSFRPKRQLTINMQTARKLGISPRFDILSTAVLLNEEPENQDLTWTLSGVAKTALLENLEVQAGSAGLKSNAEDVQQARSLLKPQFNTSLTTVQLDSDNGGVVAGQSAERTTTANVEFSQIIYSEPALAAIKIQHYQQRARAAAQRELELDIVQSATVSFLTILKAQAQLNIQRRSLNLARTNLDLAQDRVRLGSSNSSDIFRWESEVALTRQQLLDARSSLEQSKDALNKILGRPLNERFSTAPASLSDPSLLVSRQDLVEVIDNQDSFNRMGKIFLENALENSPEIVQLRALIAGQERELKSAQRQFTRPEVSLSGQIGNTLNESDAIMNSQEGDTDWQIAINVTLPLYQGGKRFSQIRQDQYSIDQSLLQLASLTDGVEQSVRANLHAVQASFPSIELAQIAADAARKNLELIQDNYNRGNESIITLLDARDASLDADLGATNATYDFLIDLMNLQRSTGEFDFFLEPQALNEYAERIKQAVSSPEYAQ
ncbi:MAG: TolC family protein [Acidiferrobacterales bacterium]|nr:TolC family protein [Acidiferrobacterales bacterium]